MKIVVSGVGETGYYLTQILLQQGHDLVLIEEDEKSFKYAQEKLDVQMIHGDGGNALILEPLIDEKTDLFVSVTNSDETNIIATLIARKFGVKRVIARISDPTNLIHPLLTDDSAVSVLNAEMAVAKDLARLTGNPSADEIEFFANGKAEMVKFHVTMQASIAFKSLKNIDVPRSWIFVGMIRKGHFTIASGETCFEPGDQVLVMGNPQKNKDIEELLGFRSEKVRRVILTGFNDVSTYVARNLVKKNVEVRLIEENKEIAEEAAAKLDGVLVIQGDATSDEILDQAGIDQTDYLLALTNDDESNVLISLLAKERSVKKVIALAQKPQYKSIIEKIGIDSVVNPRSAMVDEIIRSIHHKDLSGINILEGGKGQAVEIIVKEKAKSVGSPISKIKLPKQTLIGAIVRGEKLIIPRGSDKIEAEDHLIIFTASSSLVEVKKLFVN